MNTAGYIGLSTLPIYIQSPVWSVFMIQAKAHEWQRALPSSIVWLTSRALRFSIRAEEIRYQRESILGVDAGSKGPNQRSVPAGNLIFRDVYAVLSLLSG